MSEQNNDLVIPDRLRDLLLKTKQTVAVAESVTAGHLQVAFSLAENAREIFQGGITAYNLGQKSRHLQVDPIHAEFCNCVSEKVAMQMARQVTDMFSSHWGLSITGYASPVPERNIHQLFACYAIYEKASEKMTVKTVFVKNKSPLQVRYFYAGEIINDFYEILSLGQ